MKQLTYKICLSLYDVMLYDSYDPMLWRQQVITPRPVAPFTNMV